MVVGLIKDVPTVKELIDRIMIDADRIIRQRFAGLSWTPPRQKGAGTGGGLGAALTGGTHAPGQVCARCYRPPEKSACACRQRRETASL